MVKINKIALFLIVWFSLSSCNESPQVDFHSYQELAEYDFIINGWFPEILGDDASGILETYDNQNRHLFGKFDFKRRPEYESAVKSYLIAEKDSLFERIENISKPRYPKWFIPKEDLTDDKYIIAKHDNFYLILEKKSNRIYYLR